MSVFIFTAHGWCYSWGNFLSQTPNSTENTMLEWNEKWTIKEINELRIKCSMFVSKKKKSRLFFHMSHINFWSLVHEIIFAQIGLTQLYSFLTSLPKLAGRSHFPSFVAIEILKGCLLFKLQPKLSVHQKHPHLAITNVIFIKTYSR